MAIRREVHRRDVKKIPMTDKICQMYEEEQVNKTRKWQKTSTRQYNAKSILESRETGHGTQGRRPRRLRK